MHHHTIHSCIIYFAVHMLDVLIMLIPTQLVCLKVFVNLTSTRLSFYLHLHITKSHFLHMTFIPFECLSQLSVSLCLPCLLTQPKHQPFAFVSSYKWLSMQHVPGIRFIISVCLLSGVGGWYLLVQWKFWWWWLVSSGKTQYICHIPKIMPQKTDQRRSNCRHPLQAKLWWQKLNLHSSMWLYFPLADVSLSSWC